MKLSELVKGVIKVGGTIAKVGVEVGADVVGLVAEKIDDKPEDREKIVSSGKELGKKIKESTNKAANESVEVVDDMVRKGKEFFNDISQGAEEDTFSYEEQTNSNDDSQEDKKTSSEAEDIKTTDGKIHREEHSNGRSYIKIKTETELEKEAKEEK